MKRVYSANIIRDDLLDRFIRYCRAAHTDANYAIVDDKVYIVGLSSSRFTELANGFCKANPNIIFEYTVKDSGSRIITRLVTGGM